MFMFSNIMRIFTSPYMTIMLLDCSTHIKCHLIRKTQSAEVGLILFNAGKKMTLTKWQKGELLC